MIETLFIVFAVLCIMHFLYESCILPQIRVILKYRLFRVRDELRSNKLNQRVDDTRAYQILHDCLNNALTNVENADLFTLTEVRRELKNARVSKVIQHRLSILEDCTDERLLSTRRKMRKVMSYSVLAGTVGLFIYFTPIVVLFAALKNTRDYFSRLIRSLLVKPPAMKSHSSASYYPIMAPC
jgi:hypothetical protein